MTVWKVFLRSAKSHTKIVLLASFSLQESYNLAACEILQKTCKKPSEVFCNASTPSPGAIQEQLSEFFAIELLWHESRIWVLGIVILCNASMSCSITAACKFHTEPTNYNPQIFSYGCKHSPWLCLTCVSQAQKLNHVRQRTPNFFCKQDVLCCFTSHFIL